MLFTAHSAAQPPSRLSRWPLLLGGAALLAVLSLVACAATPPDGVKPVASFDVGRYAGHWFELARIDHRFEKGLVNTTADYSRNPDGSIQVINRGFDPVRNLWKQADGKGFFTGPQTEAALKVSFFGPFYGGYSVVALDPDYQWAMVVGSNLGYLWILSRTSTLPEGVREKLSAQATAMGVDINKVLWVEQGVAAPAPG